jgi:hypothetical protein
MAYEQKDNSGTLFKNDRREKDSHPHAKGSAMIDGVDYWVSAWTKDGAKGKFQSLSFQRKEPKPQQQSQPARQQQSYGQASGSNARELDDEIPF